MQDVKILIVEDESITALGIKHKLERLGYSVVDIESSGSGAIEKAQELEPDLILMDIVLKGEMDGIEAAQKIKLDIPIIYLTAYFDDGTLQRARSTKHYGYITKPFTDGNLKSAIEIALYKHALESSNYGEYPQILETRDEYQKLLDIIEFLPDAAFVINEDKKVIAWNKAIENITGVPKEEIIGKGNYEYSIPFYGYRRPVLIDLFFSDYGEIESRYDYIKNDQNSFYTETFVDNLFDGEGAYLFAKASLLYDNKGNTVGAIETIRDITERKNAEDNLKENENYIKTIFSTMQTGLVVIDEKTKEIIDVNKATGELIGAPEDEIIGKICHKYICPAEEGKCPVVNLNQEIDNSERVLITAKNNVIPVIKSVVPITLEGRKCLVESFINISELKKAQKALKESEIYYKTIFENAGTAMLIIEEDTTISLVNSEFEKLSGYPKEEIENNISWNKFVKEDCIPKIEEHQNTEQIKTNSAPRNYELKFTDKNGNIKDIFTKMAMIPGTRKSLVSLLDITPKKRSMKALKESRAKYRQLVENVHEGICSIDSDGIITFVNPGMAEMLGYTIEKMMGRSILSFVDEKHVELIKNYLSKHNYDLKGQYDLDFVKKDGKRIQTSVDISPIQDGDNSILVMVSDITDRKNAEKQIKDSLKEKDVLLREIHHRVKNNLQIISSLLSFQSSYVHDHDALDILTESQNRIKTMAMIHEKLYKSRSLVKINFKNYITGLTENLFYIYKISPNMIKLHINIQDVFFDINNAIPCGLIINELVTNCIKHAFPWFKTPVSLQVSSKDLEFGKYKIDIELIYENGSYVLKVADNGVGFPNNIDFENPDSLGLKLVNNLVEQLDGTITLNNTLGTVFTIAFKENDYEERM